MAYQSLKRVLSETSLERKCRVFFGTCLFLLIAGAFVLVDMIAERLVYETNFQARKTVREKGRSYAEMRLLKLHFLDYIESTKEQDDELAAVRVDLVKDMIRQFDKQRYSNSILALDGHPGTQEPQPFEADILRRLAKALREQTEQAAQAQQQWAEQQRAEQAAQSSPSPEQTAQPPPTDLVGSVQQAAEEGPFYELMSDDEKYYLFYQPFFKNSCVPCHVQLDAREGVAGAGGLGDLDGLRVVKVVIPFSPPQSAINKIRAILITAGIATFFLAMVALYVIVRYVIVNPLSHLRDVSDAISRGNTELRADIHTNDEFEELAESFNRMLRHLTDAQVDLQEVNRDLDAKVDELAQLNMRLYEMNRLKSDFLANMSHELRTPLNSIIGFSEVLQGIDSLNDKQKRYAGNIQKSGKLLLEMINDILDLAKIEAGKMAVRPSEFRLDAIVSAQCDMVRALSEEKHIDVTVELADDLPMIYQDQGKVQQILTNLLSNAIKFTPEGGRITVAAQPLDDEFCQLTVEDTGVGIADEDREIIFEKFRQSRAVLGEDGLTREYSGTGLGLSIVKELCKLLGGEVSFESEVGKGSTFCVTLPWNCNQAPHDFEINSRLNELRASDDSSLTSPPSW